MTSASCDADVAELPRLRHRTRPGKDIYITAVAAREYATEKRLPPAVSLPGRLLSVGEYWELVIGLARLRAGLPGNIAGREHAAGGISDPGNRPWQRGGWRGNSAAAPHVAAALFGLQRAPPAAAERPRGGHSATPTPNLTLMSLEADARVMTRLRRPLNADAYVIFDTR